MNRTYAWYAFDDKRTVDEKVKHAARLYFERFGVDANLCLSSPKTIGEERVIYGITLKPSVMVQPENYWLTHTDD
jgi:hypothetical protein